MSAQSVERIIRLESKYRLLLEQIGRDPEGATERDRERLRALESLIEIGRNEIERDPDRRVDTRFMN
jgi:hypothetical protein